MTLDPLTTIVSSDVPAFCVKVKYWSYKSLESLLITMVAIDFFQTLISRLTTVYVTSHRFAFNIFLITTIIYMIKFNIKFFFGI